MERFELQARAWFAAALVVCVCGPSSLRAAVPACADGQDNDEDGLVDFPLDPGCHSANDDDEVDPVAGGGVEPRLLLVVATSGTLNGETCSGVFTGGDGSIECSGSDVACTQCSNAGCGNAFADDSRLYAIREGIRLAALRGDVELGLMRAEQSPVTFVCPSSDPLSASGGWQGAELACAGGLDSGELLVDFAPANFDELVGYVNDQADDATLDFELRASGDRPLAGMLASASDHLTATRAGDPASTCRPYGVVLITDGGEGCGGDAAAVAATLAAADAPVHVVGFAATGLAEVEELNAVAQAGGTGSARFADSALDLASALDQVASDSLVFETCNGLDDDCDGAFDEDFPLLGSPCDNGGIGQCWRSGSWACSPEGNGLVCVVAEPTVVLEEICNGIDDDCDGLVDEGGVCVPQDELCNGIDDNTNGDVDEGFPVGETCTLGDGACRAAGTFACRQDQLGVACVPSTTPPSPALFDLTCDGVDDDCDGQVDEDAIDAMVQVDLGGSSFWIDAYEASRPDATSTSAGVLGHRACSKPDVLPWSLVTWSEAQQACAAAGKRLCTEQEWEKACAGAAQQVYPYGNVYAATACNGADYDADCSGFNDDLLLPTGSAFGCPAPVESQCVSSTGALDLSGNLAEWTATSLGLQTRRMRGGAFDSPATALTCTQDFARDIESAFRPNVGFRCCSDTPPPIPPILRDDFETGDFRRWNGVLPP